MSSPVRINLKNNLKYIIPLIFLTLLAFFPVINAEFINWDDDRHLLENPHVHILSAKHVREIFTSTVNETYIPLTILSFSIEHRIFGWNPAIFHINNLLLHMGAVLLIFFLALKLGLSKNGSSAAALLFAIHPMHVESVAWITERKDVLYAFFYLLALFNYSIYIKNKSRTSYTISLLCAALSILSKPMALSLPWILLLCDWLQGRKWSRRMLWDKIPFLIIIEPMAWITYSLNARAPDIQFPDSVLIGVWTSTFYIIKFFFPINFTALYQLPRPVNITNPPYLFATITLLTVLVLCYYFRKNKWFIFACLYYCGSTFFLWRYDAADASIVADRFMYLPSLGVCLWAGTLYEIFSSKWKRPEKAGYIFQGACVIFLGLFMIKSHFQARIWKNSLSFWNHVIKVNPQHHIAYNNRGMLFQEGQYITAMRDFDKAAQLKPDYAEAYYNLGLTLSRLGRHDQAVKLYNRTIEIDPGFIQAYNNLGYIYVNIKDDLEMGLRLYDEALKHNPRFAESLNNRGSVYNRQKKWKLALNDFNKAIAHAPHFPDPYYNRARLHLSQKAYQKALTDFNQLLRLSPDNAFAFYGRSLTYKSLGDKKRAFQDAEKANALGLNISESYLESLK